MNDTIYKEENVSDNVRPIFDQLVEEFGSEYEIWVRESNFNRIISGGIVNRNTLNGATIVIQTAKGIRSQPLSKREINEISDHLKQKEKCKDIEF